MWYFWTTKVEMIKFAPIMVNCVQNNLWKFRKRILKYTENNDICLRGSFFRRTLYILLRVSRLADVTVYRSGCTEMVMSVHDHFGTSTSVHYPWCLPGVVYRGRGPTPGWGRAKCGPIPTSKPNFIKMGYLRHHNQRNKPTNQQTRVIKIPPIAERSK